MDFDFSDLTDLFGTIAAPFAAAGAQQLLPHQQPAPAAQVLVAPPAQPAAAPAAQTLGAQPGGLDTKTVLIGIGIVAAAILGAIFLKK